jgi:ATP-dependent helicase/nuclease subunit A
MHKFMQFADYQKARENLSAEIERMAEKQFLSHTEAESLDRKKLKQFFSGKLARRIFASGNVMRELRFVGQCGAELLGDVIEGMEKDSKIALQGVADCVFIENGGAIIVDYKTDYAKDASQLLNRYGGQLALYREILKNSLPTPVAGCIIYSFYLGEEILVK